MTTRPGPNTAAKRASRPSRRDRSRWLTRAAALSTCEPPSTFRYPDGAVRCPCHCRVDLPPGLVEKAGASENGSMHELYLHNSATRRKERFVPLDPQHVRMYVCGPTVYDLVHVGNARPVVVYDVLLRAAAAALSACHLCPQHHRRRGQDQRARPGTRRTDRRADRAHHRRLPCRYGGTRRPAAGRGTTRDAAHRAE